MLKDVVMDLSDELTQNEYINNLRNGQAIKKIAMIWQSAWRRLSYLTLKYVVALVAYNRTTLSTVFIAMLHVYIFI